jgi:hypothetical protein
MTAAGDRVLPFVIGTDSGNAMRPAVVGGLAAVAALVTVVTAVDNQSLGSGRVLLRRVVDLGQLKARAGVDKGWQGAALEDLGLELVRGAQAVDKLQG